MIEIVLAFLAVPVGAGVLLHKALKPKKRKTKQKVKVVYVRAKAKPQQRTNLGLERIAARERTDIARESMRLEYEQKRYNDLRNLLK